MSSLITAQLLFLEAEDASRPIRLYINSPGGSVTAGLAIYDTMQYISSPVHTFCLGQAASMGSLLLAGGEKGKRFALKNSSVMIHRELTQLAWWCVEECEYACVGLASVTDVVNRALWRRVRPGVGHRPARKGDSQNPCSPDRHLRRPLHTYRRGSHPGEGAFRYVLGCHHLRAVLTCTLQRRHLSATTL